MIIAIDGPSASGKSTTARCIAEKLKILHIDTGAMYRAITLACIQNRVMHTDSDDLVSLIENINISFDSNNQVCINKKNVESLIRNQVVTSQVSNFSAVRIIREKMVDRQRQISKNNDCVIEGRDIGTVVFPNADFKFYLDASAEIRASRRMTEFKNNGEIVVYDDVVRKIKERDHFDMNRKISPLTKAKEAIVIDTTDLDIKEQIKKIISIVNNK